MKAHAEDEWPIGNQYNPTVPAVYQHKTIKDRIKIAKQFLHDFDMKSPHLTVVCDDMKNEFDQNYAAWPFRFYIINPQGQIALKAQPKVGIYELNDIVNYFKSYSKQEQKQT